MVSYNLVMNLVEVVWKDQLRTLYPQPSDYNAYVNQLTSVMASFPPSLLFAWLNFTTARLDLDRHDHSHYYGLTCLGFFSFLFFKESRVAD